MVTTLKSSATSPNTALAVLPKDPYVDDVAAGSVVFVFDLMKDFAASHAHTAYSDAAAIADLSDTADGTYETEHAQTVTSGTAYGGANFAAITRSGNRVQAPAGALNAIHDGAQYFLVLIYAVLPSQADWNDNASIAPFFCASPGTGGYFDDPDLVTISQVTGGDLDARRQTSGSTTADLSLTVPVGAYGQPAQIAYWRNAAGSGLLLHTAATGITSATGSVGADNVDDFSTSAAQWGVPLSLWDSSNPMGTDHLAASNFTLLRGVIENLELSGRDPGAMAAADWQRFAARIAALA